MFASLLLIKIFVAILVMVVFLCGGMTLWQYTGNWQKKIFSDQQIVWLLVGLSALAVIILGTFLLTLFRK